MPKVLIFGATGQIGGALARSLRRSGNHTVYGVARSPEKARHLAAQEIIPVMGSATESTAWRALIRDAHIDVVVDAAQALQEANHIIREIREAGAERLQTAREQKVASGGAKLGFIYTSGNWLHGSTKPGQVINDLDPVIDSDAPKPLAWRVDTENSVLNSADILDVAVVRPGEVYGFSSGLFNFFFKSIEKAIAADAGADVSLLAGVESRVSTVHADDAGSGLHAVVDKLPLLNGTGVWPVFDLVSSVESLSMLLTHAARALGATGQVIFESPEGHNTMVAAISTSVVIGSGRAKSLLGWNPTHNGMLGEIDLYVRAWKASQAV